MTNWINLRFAWIDKQFPGTPKISSAGNGQQGFTVTITRTNTYPIYYTTNGTDPRLSRGGISQNAILYSGPFSVSGNARIFARAIVLMQNDKLVRVREGKRTQQNRVDSRKDGAVCAYSKSQRQNDS